MTTIKHAFAGAVAAGAIMLAGSMAGEAAGALAIGSCAAYGTAYDFAATREAERAALRKCSGTCKVVATVHHGCAAFAIDGRNACGPHGYASARELGPAENAALRYCYRYGGRDCVVRAWACDGSG